MEENRKVLPKQEKVLDKKNRMKIGVFADYFTEFDLLRRKRLLFQNTINKNSLTEWQAIEVLHEKLFMIAAVFKFGKMNRSLLLVYDRETKKLEDYSSTSYLTDKAYVTPSLVDNSVSIRKTKDTLIKLTNQLDKDKLYLEGYAKDLDFKVEFDRIADPVVISLQMSKNHSVYTEKDLFVPKGKISFKGTEYVLDHNDITILDDHRGYYPLSSGYDWFTCMGNINYQEQVCKFAINLTRFYKNISSDVSENGFWLNKRFYQLPEVSFKREDSIWRIKDDEGMVDLSLKIGNRFKENRELGLKIDYLLAFGEVSGVIKYPGLEDIQISNMFALGEKRLTKLPLQSPYAKEKSG